MDFLSKNLTEFVNKNEIRYEPLGVCLLITPWNFPIATILRKLIPAFLVGNTIIVKASEYTPYSSIMLFKLFEKVNIPAGVVNLIVGRGEKLVPSMIKSGKIKAISFTGSVENGQKIAKIIDPIRSRYQAELGGNNTVFILKDADLTLAANSVVVNALACSGQWCTGTGRIIVEESVHDELVSIMVKKVNQIKVGNGFEENVTMGPIINEIQLKRIESAVKQAKSDGANILIGGKKCRLPELKKGNFFEPTIIDNVTTDMLITDTEIFGPVILFMTVKNVHEAIEIINQSKYGLTFSVYTQNEKLGNQIIDDVDSGLCHLNLPTTMRIPPRRWTGYSSMEGRLP